MAKTYGPEFLRDPASLWGALRGGIVTFLLLELASIALSVANLTMGAAFDQSLPLALAATAQGIVYLVTYIFCIVVTCRITYRMMRNLHALQAPVEMMSPPWAAGFYFVPVLFLFKPLQGVKQMQRGTDALLPDVPAAESGQTGFWWGTWIISNILANIAFRMTFDPDMQNPTLALQIGIAGSVISALSCVLMLDVFGRLSNGQSRMLAHRAAPPE